MKLKAVAVRATFLALLAVGTSAHAQATRTWISGVGDDVNPCSRTAPCKTWAGAIPKTAAGGEINVLDSGGFGALVITKSISLVAQGVVAGMLISGTNGITVNAGANDQVTLKGLDLELIPTTGGSAGLSGIRFIGGGSLVVDECRINGGSQKGISFEPQLNARLTVRNTLITNAANPTDGGGIYIHPGNGAAATATIDRVELTGNQFGVRADDNSRVLVTNSTISNSTANAVVAASTGVGVEITVQDSSLVHSGGFGAKAVGAGAVVRLSNTQITGNAVGMNGVQGGVIQSFGNNSNFGNTNNGAPTGAAIPLQ